MVLCFSAVPCQPAQRCAQARVTQPFGGGTQHFPVLRRQRPGRIEFGSRRGQDVRADDPDPHLAQSLDISPQPPFQFAPQVTQSAGPGRRGGVQGQAPGVEHRRLAMWGEVLGELPADLFQQRALLLKPGAEPAQGVAVSQQLLQWDGACCHKVNVTKFQAGLAMESRAVAFDGRQPFGNIRHWRQEFPFPRGRQRLLRARSFQTALGPRRTTLAESANARPGARRVRFCSAIQAVSGWGRLPVPQPAGLARPQSIPIRK